MNLNPLGILKENLYTHLQNNILHLVHTVYMAYYDRLPQGYPFEPPG